MKLLGLGCGRRLGNSEILLEERHEHFYTKNDEIKQKLEKYKAYKTYSKPSRAAS